VRFLAILLWYRGFSSRPFVSDACNRSLDGGSIAKDSRSFAPVEASAIIFDACMMPSVLAIDVGVIAGGLVSYTMRSGHFGLD
jgi:hypothetical protein